MKRLRESGPIVGGRLMTARGWMLAGLLFAQAAQAQAPAGGITPVAYKPVDPARGDNSLLDRPTTPAPPKPLPPLPDPYGPSPPHKVESDPPPGFTGRSGVLPTEVQEDGHFVP